MQIRSAIACAALAPLFIGAAPEVVRLQPTTPWVVDYGENSCRLIRTFGEGATEISLVLESRTPQDIDMVVTGKPLSTNRQEMPARFLPVGSAMFDGRVAQTVGSKVPAIVWSSEITAMLPDAVVESERKDAELYRQYAEKGQRPPPIDLAKEQELKRQRQKFAAAATSLEIYPRSNRSVILETGPMGAAINRFDQCGRDLAKVWGVDPDLEDKIVRPVWMNSSRGIISSDDYPQAMLDKGAGSEVSVRLLIDATGKITKCTSLSHFAEPEFNRVTCAVILKRARFAPAELADGTKVPSYTAARFIFRVQ